MTRQSLIDPPAANRRLPLLPNPRGEANESTAAAAKTTATATARGRGRARLAEGAGRTAADCTALCCCCPCTVVNLLALAVYRVPAGLCRRVRRRRQRSAAAKRKKKGGLLAQRPNSFAAGWAGAADPLEAGEDGVDAGWSDGDEDDAVDDLEMEMWGRFHGAGFWRSPSTRDT